MMEQVTSQFVRRIIIRSLWMMLFPILLFAGSAVAQPYPDALWTRIFGGEYGDAAYDIQQTPDGGYIVAAQTFSFGSGTYLIKLDAAGDTLWTRVHEEHEDIQFSKTIASELTADGGFIILGEGRVNMTGHPCLTKTDSLGNILWAKAFEIYEDSWQAKDMCQTSDGGYAIVANKRIGTSPNITFIKTDSLGDTLWTKSCGGPGSYHACGVLETEDGGYTIAGTVWTPDESSRYYLVKTDSGGNPLWEQTYGPEWQFWASALAQTSDGGYVIAGEVCYGDDSNDIYVVWVDASGDTLWARTYEFRIGDNVSRIEATDDDGFIICGTTILMPPDSSDEFLIRINQFGDTLWTRTYGAQSSEEYSSGSAVRQTLDGGYVIAGSIYNDSTQSMDVYVVKTGPDIAAVDVPRPLPTTIVLHQNYPNPFNATTRIAFDLPKAGPVTLRVYDLLGREVATLVEGIRAAGHHTALFDGSGFASGIYFYRLEAAELHETKKMVLLK